MRERHQPNPCANPNNKPIAAHQDSSQGWSRRPRGERKSGHSATRTCLPRCPGPAADPPSKVPKQNTRLPYLPQSTAPTEDSQSPAPSDPGEHPRPPPSDSASTLRLTLALLPQIQGFRRGIQIPARFPRIRGFRLHLPPSHSGPSCSSPLSDPDIQIPALFPSTQRCRPSPPPSDSGIQILASSLRSKRPDSSCFPPSDPALPVLGRGSVHSPSSPHLGFRDSSPSS